MKASKILFSDEEKNSYSEVNLESGIKDFFPLEIKSDKGKANGNLIEYEKEIAPLISKSKQKIGKGYELLFEEVNTRKNGKQTSIRAIMFSCEEDFLFTVKKKNEAKNFEDALYVLKNELNGFKNKDLLYELYDWSVHHFADLTLLHKNESDFRQNICLCVNFLCENPNTQKYIRELPLKIGNNSLSEILLTLEDFVVLPKSGIFDSINKIFILENEMVYLTFPKVQNALCIWEHGFSAVELKNATWLSSFPLYYFGDLDEHGFLILSDFRKYFPNAKSFCMDLQTLKEFSEFCVEGKTLQG